MRLQHSVFRTYVNLLHLVRDERDKATRPSAAAAAAKQQQQDQQQQPIEEETVNFSPELERQIVALSQDPDIYNKLVTSFAPSIVGRDDVKKGILCQLVGGSRLLLQQQQQQQQHTRQQRKQRPYRSDLHVLLCGDPATAKSQLLQYVHQIAPR
ncbi:DNA replication licensing factor, putative [Eimeria necatrix]|uniref:DNA replication licensing factor, putative n=1 Tax=Eimeria necatrix TaxID=51315 RepID=U6N3H5_9EIME|nr:DNA replication licensing factor, putative [Eimeria necatrix]CDJ69859.1 DNA replication licensing factor, putative [Eimeria necatrix]